MLDNLAWLQEHKDIMMVVRLVLAAILGGIVGIERGSGDRPAGFRTHILVCVGSALFMLVSMYGFDELTPAEALHEGDLGARRDSARIAAQVVSGIGFLGAGTIIVTGHNQIKGLTTAAGLWASAGVGLALGFGFYEAALTAAIGIYVILTILQRLESRVNKKIRVFEIYVELLTSIHLSDFTKQLRSMDIQIEGIQFESDDYAEGGTRGAVIALKTKQREDHDLILEKIRAIDGVAYLEEL